LWCARPRQTCVRWSAHASRRVWIAVDVDCTGCPMCPCGRSNCRCTQICYCTTLQRPFAQCARRRPCRLPDTATVGKTVCYCICIAKVNCCVSNRCVCNSASFTYEPHVPRPSETMSNCASSYTHFLTGRAKMYWPCASQGG
jgi:hypothetical protein